MKLTPRIIAAIQVALHDKGWTQAKLAEAIGYHRSTISKLLKGEQDTISLETVDAINDALGTDLAPIPFREGEVSKTALDLSALAENDPAIAELLERFVRVLQPAPIEPFLPQVDTKHLSKIGAEVTRIVHKWEEAEDPHYAKIAVETLDYLRRWYAKKR